MAEITGTPQPVSPWVHLTSRQLKGDACRICDTTIPPLHPDETMEVRGEGVVRDVVVTVLCTPHLGHAL
ncbi:MULTISPECIES: hypothetical protein [unclassified Kitasatospora]|uniref:hypothetical protein n=1 Tax=unclassified Kitasatospora TaxID=2633591 RepID=UPI000B319ACA|nr:MULTISPECIES: hypothetical protein [unclassified Kitasatospora]